MGDQIVNGVLVLLLSGVIVSMVFLFQPPILLSTPLACNRSRLPIDWVEIQGRWACANVTPESLSAMLRVLRTWDKVPARIRLEPPVAEVIW